MSRVQIPHVRIKIIKIIKLMGAHAGINQKKAVLIMAARKKIACINAQRRKVGAVAKNAKRSIKITAHATECIKEPPDQRRFSGRFFLL